MLALAPVALAAAEPRAAPLAADASGFVEMRTAYAGRPDYDPQYFRDVKRLALTRAIQEKDPERIVALGRLWLERCPVDADAHIQVGRALVGLGRRREAFRHMYSFHGLVQSILDSGNGASKKTAMKVISVAEEYVVMRVLGAKVVRQSLEGKTAKYDVIEVEIDGQEATLYFDVSISVDALQRQLERKNEGGGR